MTKENKMTETRLLITQDSPHQGGNIPIGMQFFLYDFGAMKIGGFKIGKQSNQLKQFYTLNDQPATQSQLILRVTDADGNYSTNSFLAPNGPYRQMVDFSISDPSPAYQFKAVSQGSQCGVWVMPTNTTFIDYSDNISKLQVIFGILTSAKYKLTANIKALPDLGSTNISAYSKMERNIRFFFGLLGTGWKTTYEYTRPSPQNITPWDCVPGSTQSISGRNGSFGDNSLEPSVNSSHTFFGNVWRAILFPLVHVRTDFTVSYQQDLFSFVPINSSLDIANADINTFNRTHIFSADGLAGSRSMKYIAQEKFTNVISGMSVNFYNKNHTDFSKRNATFIYNEMEPPPIPPNTNCDDICSNLIKIDGLDNLCISGTYTIPYLPSYITVTWSSSNTNVATVTQNGNTATVTQVTSGPFTLTATLNFNGGNNCNIPQSLTKLIYTGLPYFGATYKDGRVSGNPVAIYFPNQGNNNLFNNVCIGYNGIPNVYIDAQPSGSNNISWSVPSGYATTAFSLYTGYGNRAYFAWNYGGATPPGYIQASVSNGCGTFSQIFAFKQINCNPTGGDPCGYAKEVNYYTISPNPATDIINIGTTNRPPPINCNGLRALNGNNGVIFSQVNIYNHLGTIIKSYRTINAKTASIKVGNLITGSYLVEIIQGDYIEKQQLIIQK